MNILYAVLFALISAGFIFLTVAEAKCSSLKKFKKLHLIDCAAVGAGICGIAATLILFNIRVKSSVYDDEFSAWVGDMFFLFIKISLTMCVFMLLITAAAGILNIAEKKAQRGYSGFIRNFVPILCCVTMALFTIIFAYVSKNDVMNVDAYVVSLGVFESMTLRLMHALDGFAKRKRLVLENGD